MARVKLDSVLESAFRIRPGESRRVGLMFLYLMGVVSTFIVGRTVRDTLFLSRYELSRLPLMYIAVAVSVSAASYGYSRFADRHRRDVTIRMSLALSAVVTTLLWGLLFTDVGGGWIYPVLYVVVEIVGALSIIQFWTFANDIYSAREAKRLFGVIGAGGVLSNIFCGFAIGYMVPLIGAENLLLVTAIILSLCVLAVRALGRLARTELEQAVHRPKKARIGFAADSGAVLGSRHLKLIAGIVAVTFLTVSIIDYQFKVVAKATYGEAELASFFGYFYGFTGIVSSLIQFFGTSRLLERRGIVAALAVLPVGLFVGVGTMLLPMVGMLAAVTLAKAAENIFRYTVNDASTQLLYVPVPAHYRGRAKAFIDGILKPVSIGVAGLVLMGLGGVIPKDRFAIDLAYVDLAMLAAWVAMVFAIRREYVKSLIDTLHARKLDFNGTWRSINDDSTVRMLKASLRSTELEQVLHALELVPVTDADFRPELLELLGHPAKEARIAALRILGGAGRAEDLPAIKRVLDEPDLDDEQRAAALGAFCAIGKEGSIREVVPFLSHKSPKIEGAAVTALIQHGGLDGVLTAAETLKALLKSADPAGRIEGARVLGRIRVKNFYHPVLELLRDPSPAVRLAAIEAAGAMSSPELVPAIIRCLEHRETTDAAVRALACYGTSIERTLFGALEHEPTPIGRKIPKVLAAIGGQPAVTELLRLLETPDDELRTAIAKAISRIRQRVPGIRVDEARLDAAIKREIRAAYQALATVVDLGLGETGLVPDALLVRHRVRLELAFRLLEVRYPAKTIQTVYSNLGSESKALRANALEVVDNVLSKEESRLLLPLLEDLRIAEKVTRGEEHFELERHDAETWIARLLDDDHFWVVTCALQLAAERRLTGLAARAARALDAPDAIVRETACLTLAALLPSLLRGQRPEAIADPTLVEKVTRLNREDAPEVRRASRSLLDHLASSPT